MQNNKYSFPINQCPHCGGGTIKIRQHIHGYGEYLVDLENGEIESSSLHDYLYYKNTGKYALCADCGKRLFKVDDELNVIQ
ncbi:hypothetical protein [Lacrimispora saccharolytica]|uniref:Uncharacterized protein n=1 Tax=Lacrimispora saccharolytica (strain ATCC 35040 / DSM 2544 / NRCC 2533 / WM1) TaxID=610130 RepID=D9R5F2_LACSW|nr:hypothetical protein [Lacrimispora saccharolytica]ADL03358.1 hypothetical protein Closa_0733 [[Clostridium] saccharolyticum WM1]ADL03981.1 hypothetical protein Closa_1379 [[Clostridium] saccharolyticum WM1]QRV18484.1 hypothetical protein I6K70_13110 [Lacrimispora saccharolytica]QRV21714.1 hypothetical protein I6K70_09875 [Lacrimispora saccharolytica]